MANEIKRDTVDYRDPTPFDNTKLNSLSDISKALRHKTYGEDTREAIAQQGEALAKIMQETGGNQTAEVAAARGKFELLGIREDAQDNAINSLELGKADKNYVDNYLAQLSNAPEYVKDYADLIARYPNGHAGLYVTSDTNNKYFWEDGKWVDKGAYAAQGIGDNYIVPKQVDHINADQISLNEIIGINPVPWNDPDKKLAISFDGKYGYFQATSAASDQPDSGILFEATRKSGDYTLYLNGITSTLSKVPIYIVDMSGAIKWKPGEYFVGGATNESQPVSVTAEMLEGSGVNVGDKFQLLISVHKEEVGGKTVHGFIQLLRDTNSLLSKRPLNLMDHLESIDADLNRNAISRVFKGDYTVDTNLTRWFSERNFEIKDDVITYWRTGVGEPGPYYQMTKPVATGQTVYVYFEAQKLKGEKTSLNIQFVNTNLFSSTPTDFRVAYQVPVRLSNRWETYLVPVKLDREWFKSDTSTMGAIISIAPTSNEECRVQLRNAALVYGDNNSVELAMLEDIAFNEQIVPELKHGRRKGELLPSDATISLLPKVHYVSPKSAVVNKDLFLNSITVNVTKAGKINFAVGAVDQNNLMIKSSEFSLDLPAGTRTIELKEDISIPTGNRLFMDCNSQGVLYASPNATEKILIEDEDHLVSNGGYSGYELYESELMAPFSYTVRPQRLPNQIKTIGVKAEDNAKKIDGIQNSLNILTSPNGQKYKLAVNDDGSLTTVSLQAHKGFFFGNSLTVGLDNYGMAASNEAHSWATLVGNRLKELEPSFTFKRFNGNDIWEGKTTSADRLASLNNLVKPALDPDTDLVIIQLTDNVNTPEKRATFPQDSKDLITWFKQQAPKARIVWVATWFGDDLVHYVKEACEERGAIFVDITEYAKDDKYKSALGLKWTDSKGVEHVIDNPGVAAHPGDLGMQMIANKVMGALGI